MKAENIKSSDSLLHFHILQFTQFKVIDFLEETMYIPDTYVNETVFIARK